MRVAMMISAKAVNGAAVHCLLLTRFLAQRGHAVLLCHRPGSWIAGQPVPQGVERFDTTFGRWPAALMRVDARLKAFGAQVMHTHMSSAHSYGAAARLFNTLPVVATAHAAHFQLHWALNHCIIATSPEVRDYHVRYNFVRPRRIVVVPNFIDTDRFTPAAADAKARARGALAIPEDAFVVGSVGDLVERKRPVDLVRAFVPLGRANPRARLLLAGAPFQPMADEVGREAAQHGLQDRVMIVGVRADVENVLAAIDVFLHASSFETGPLAVLEAMACGLPILATDVGSVPDFVVEGQTGHRHPIGATEAMARNLLALAADPERRAAFGAAGRAHVMARYAVETVAPRIEAVLEAASRERNRPPLGFVAAIARALGPVRPA